MCFSIYLQNFSLGQITFQKVYQTSGGNALGYSVKQTFEGGYIVLGENSGNIFLMKTNATGDTIWTRLFNLSMVSLGLSVQQTSDSGFVITGQVNYPPNGYQAILIKTNPSGNLSWVKTYFNNSEGGFSVKQTFDGGYIASGFSGDFTLGSSDACLIKTDASGNPLWAKTYGGIYNDIASDVQQTSDSGYIICGYSEIGGIDRDVYIIKTNANGDTLWTKTYGTAKINTSYSMEETSDGGYILTGYSRDSLTSDNILLMKTDGYGTLQWSKSYGDFGSDIGNSVHQTLDGGFIIAGIKDFFNQFEEDIFLIKTNELGDTLWTKTIGSLTFGNDFDECFSVASCNDGGFILTGNTRSFIAGVGLYLIKTDSVGNSGCYSANTTINVGNSLIQESSQTTFVSSTNTNVTNPVISLSSGCNIFTTCLSTYINEPISKTMQFTVYPNPVRYSLTLNFHKVIAPHTVEISITNILCKKIQINPFQTSTGETKIDVSTLQPGIYFVKAGNETRKFVKE